MKAETVMPDYESARRIERNYPGKTPPQIYLLAKRDVLMRLAGARLRSDGRTWDVSKTHKVTAEQIREHNRNLRKNGMSVLNPHSRLWGKEARAVIEELTKINPSLPAKLEFMRQRLADD